MPKKPVKVYLDGPLRTVLARIAQAEEISRSEVLRNAFRMYTIRWTAIYTNPKVKALEKEQ